MAPVRAKRSDIYGHGSEDDESMDFITKDSSPAVPHHRANDIMKNDPPDEPPSSSRGVNQGQYGSNFATVPSMFARTGPPAQQMQQHVRMNEHYGGPVDVDSDSEFLRSVMNGRKSSGLSKRPSLEDSSASLRAAQKREGMQNNGAKAAPFQSNLNTTMSNCQNQMTTYSQGTINHRNETSRDGSSRLKSILLNKQKEQASETATNVTRGSSTTSFFGNARSKLKVYLSTYKHKKKSSDKGHHILGPESIPGVRSEAGVGYISGTKNPRYRQRNMKQDNPPFNRSSSFLSSGQSVASSSNGDLISHTNTIKTKYRDDASISSKNSKNSKKTRNKSTSNNAEPDICVQVFDLPWSDKRPDSHLRGRYSGPVDNSFLPHGEGMVVLQDNDESLKCVGFFEHGMLVSNLTCQRKDKVFDADKIAPASTKPAKNVRIREPQEPSGTLGDDIPLNPPHLHNNRHTKKKTEKKHKHHVKESPSKRRSSDESYGAKDIEQFFNSRKSPPSKVSDTPVSDDIQPTPLRQKYNLGDIARTPRDMIIHKSNNEAIHSASLLKKYEQAFLKRSNGLWTTAVLADRSLQPIKGKQNMSSHWYSEWEIDATSMKLEDSMLFVINGDGATKIVQRRHWGKYVRRMIVHEMEEVIEEEMGDKSSAAGTDEA